MLVHNAWYSSLTNPPQLSAAANLSHAFDVPPTIWQYKQSLPSARRCGQASGSGTARASGWCCASSSCTACTSPCSGPLGEKREKAQDEEGDARGVDLRATCATQRHLLQRHILLVAMMYEGTRTHDNGSTPAANCSLLLVLP